MSAETEREAALRHFRARRPREALACWDRALDAGMAFATDAGERWECCMLLGRFAEAWRISDHVLTGRDPADADKPDVPAHLRFVWTGLPLVGRSILIKCYHGLGDTLHFIRYAPLLRSICPRVSVMAVPELLPILERVPGIDRLVPLDWRTPEPPHEVAIELMEIPHAVRTTIETIPAAVPYLSAPPALVRRRAARMKPDGRLRVGIVWSAGDWDPRRSVPLAAFRALADLPGIALYSLQRGGAERTLRGPDGFRVENPDDSAMAVEDTAALIANLDLVITVDTMVAHLAGAMGAPAWLLLHHQADWRWMVERDDSPWYPTMRLYRQTRPGDWSQPISEIGDSLRAELRARPVRGAEAAG